MVAKSHRGDHHRTGDLVHDWLAPTDTARYFTLLSYSLVATIVLLAGIGLGMVLTKLVADSPGVFLQDLLAGLMIGMTLYVIAFTLGRVIYMRR